MKVVKITNLTEQLEHFNESRSLTEAWNPTFPAWLSARLTQIRQAHGTEKGNDRERGKVPWREIPDYTKPRGWWGNDRELGLVDALLKKYDLSSLNVIEGPVPEGRKDERLKNTNFIPIWGFSNGQVFIPGFNDNEIADLMNDGKPKAFKYIPAKYIYANANHFAYFDKTTAKPSKYHQTRGDRRQMATDLQNTGYSRQGKDPQKFVGSTYKKTVDKSGYLVDPQKYVKKLEDIRANDYAKVLQDRYEGLCSYRDDITSAMNYYDPVEDVDMFDKLNDLTQYLKWASKEYNNIANKIQDCLNSSEWDEEQRKEYIKSQVKQLMNDSHYERIGKVGEDVFLGSADWLD